MPQATWSVLIFEDSEGDQVLLSRILAKESACTYVFAERLSEGIERLSEGAERLGKSTFDIILLDLNLPDTQGMEGLLKIRSHSPHVPVVVLTGMDDDKNGYRAVQQGAQDYIVKANLKGELLLRSMGYAIERHRLLQELADTRQREKMERELRTLERTGSTLGTLATASVLGQLPLHERRQDAFVELIHRYEDLIDLALEQRLFKTERDLTCEVRALAERLGFLKSTPRDLVKVHSATLTSKTATAPSRKIQAYREEAQYMLLEIMGHLCSFYRRYSIVPSEGSFTGAAAAAGQEVNRTNK
ncbi:response regulator [Mariniblastus sp.]|nr:response regulator [Mariniblastus sp.]